MELNSLIVATALVAALSVFWLTKFVRNTYFHPLAGIPGPWWAATYLGEFYYDVVKGGQYFKKVEQLHEIYGRTQPP